LSSQPIQLIAGLSNPGKEYEATRHNAGAWFVALLAELSNTALRRESKFRARYASATFHQQSCHLLIPTTFMNLSGQAVAACMHYHKITPHTLLVAHDDIDLPVGCVRLKYDGGDGGHNGLKDVIQHLNTKQFYRLRIGVGHPGPGKKEEVSDYVLHPPSKADRKKIDDSLQQALTVLPLILDGEMAQAMQMLHTE